MSKPSKDTNAATDTAIDLTDPDAVRGELARRWHGYIGQARALLASGDEIHALERAHREAAGASALPSGIASGMGGAIAVSEGFAGVSVAVPATADAAIAIYKRAIACGDPKPGIHFEPTQDEQFALACAGRLHDAIHEHDALVREAERAREERLAPLRAELAEAERAHRVKQTAESELRLLVAEKAMGRRDLDARIVACEESVRREQGDRDWIAAQHAQRQRDADERKARDRAAEQDRRAALQARIDARTKDNAGNGTDHNAGA